jgi:hypothetical protein
MINALTWHRLCISGYIMFPGLVAIWLLPENSPFAMLALAALGWGMLVALIGAVMGVRFALGRLGLGCPRCNAPSRVTGGNHDGVFLACPACGDLRLKLGSPFGLKATKMGSVEGEFAGYNYGPRSPLRAPLRHFGPFAILCLPVVASIAVASVIHKFSFFYLLIPGFWCYAVGGLIVDAVCAGQMSDNHGTASRSRMPLRFWSKVLIWSLAYLFATAFPVGFAIQERNRANARTLQVGTSTLPAADESK